MREAAKAAALVAAAAKARDLIIESMFNHIPVATTTGVAERLLNAAVGGAASGLSQVGVRTIIGAALNAAHPALAALQNGGGKKRRRRTTTHKKRGKTKRMVKHGKRRQTKKRQNKRTKSRTKQ